MLPVLLFIMTLGGDESAIWISTFICVPVFILLLCLVRNEYLMPNKVEIENSYFTFYYPFHKPQSYNFGQLKFYMRVCRGGRGTSKFHGLVFVFEDGHRVLVAERSILNYNDFLNIVKNSGFYDIGYVGTRNWRKINGPLQKKLWAPEFEKELLKDIDKKKGQNYYRFYAAQVFFVSLVLIYILFFLL